MVYSFAPIAVNKTGYYLHASFVCAINWHSLEPYYLTIACIIIVPCLLGTVYNFLRIFYLQFLYQSHRCEAKLTEADVQYLMDPNHKMSISLVILFWLSWLPYIVHIVEAYTSATSIDEPAFILYWIGRCHVIYRMPILIICFSRYRTYLQAFCVPSKETPTSPQYYKKLWTSSNPFRCEEQTIYM